MSLALASWTERTSPTMPMISTGTLLLVIEQCLADRVLVRENFFRAGLADEDHVLMSIDIVLIEIAAGENRNSPGPEKSRCQIVRWRAFAFADRRDVAFRSRVKCRTGATEEREITAERGVLESRRFAQRVLQSLPETRARCHIGISRLRER